jgi:hypothetical protein
MVEADACTCPLRPKSNRQPSRADICLVGENVQFCSDDDKLRQLEWRQISSTELGALSKGKRIMKKTMLLAGAAMIGVGFLAAHANAQGVPQTVEITRVDVQKVAAGYRASKVIGSSVLNDANETIGKIDDLLVTHDGKEPYAVLSIGGFLGMGTHLVVIRYDNLKFAGDKIVLPGGTKDGLKILPTFQYSKE